jgi:hypothetical protein
MNPKHQRQQVQPTLWLPNGTNTMQQGALHRLTPAARPVNLWTISAAACMTKLDEALICLNLRP